MNNQFAISAKNIAKSFTTSEDPPGSLKSYLVNLSTGNLFRSKVRRASVLKDISFDIKKGEIVGIMGRNGTGKSTLIRILSGIYKPDSGSLKVNGRVAAMVGLGAGFHPDLSGWDNIFLNAAIVGFSRQETKELVYKIVDFSELGMHIYQPVKKYSSGMQMRLAFSVAIHIDASILLLDEILGVGDEGFQKKSLTKLTELIHDGRTIILITHDPYSIRKYCQRCIVLDNGYVKYDGEPDLGTQAYSHLFL